MQVIKNVDYGSSISCVAWRPGYASCLATCASLGGVNDYKIHVWDAEREYLPLTSFKAGVRRGRDRQRAAAAPAPTVAPGPAGAGGKAAPAAAEWQLSECGGHIDDVTGLLWLSAERLLSCSKDGSVRLWRMEDDGVRPYHTISTVAAAWSPSGTLSVAGAPIVRDWSPRAPQRRVRCGLAQTLCWLTAVL